MIHMVFDLNFCQNVLLTPISVATYRLTILSPPVPPVTYTLTPIESFVVAKVYIGRGSPRSSTSNLQYLFFFEKYVISTKYHTIIGIEYIN
jgi:hypothetical protein